MKITSVELTIECDEIIKRGDAFKISSPDKNNPIFKVEYEEYTPTGLKATGTMLLKDKTAAKISEFFQSLEAELSESQKSI